ncbi:MAG: ATP-binding cassette domain-containing protein [Bdellovibrionales bacterium]|nr:ATP-binding cassette domain-containing protein [Bdellovibrionales bacterium]
MSASANTPAIRFDSVSKAFGSKKILSEVSFEIARGEIVFVLGKSGMGKSVTLKHIIGVMKPDAGRVFVEGKDLSTLDSRGLSGVRRRCGMVFQQPALLDSLTVYENVAFGLKSPEFRTARAASGQKELTENEIQTRVVEVLELVKLDSSILNLNPPQISYGMQKRVSLARTLAPGPSHLLFDEPTTGLDPITTQAVNKLIRELSDKLKVTSVVVSHDMACALQIADRVLVLDQARILVWGTIPEIRQSKEPLIQDFLSEALEFESQSGQEVHR